LNAKSSEALVVHKRLNSTGTLIQCEGIDRDESEAAAILAELRTVLREHNEYMRAMALRMLNHSSQAAD
jgi:hypothetical protein